MKDFKDKVVVITGAGSGIGLALARQLSAMGAQLVLADWNADSLAAAIPTLSAPPALTTVLDVSQRAAVYDFAYQTVATCGQVDLVINNAGIALDQNLLEQTSYEAFERVVNVNMWGVIYGSLAFLPYLKKRPEAGLVNVSSIFGIVGYPSSGAYSVTKFAVRGFTETLRQELAHTLVYVGCVHPGGIRTNIVRNIPFDDTKRRERFVNTFDKMAKTSPETAAQVIIEGIRRKKKRILIGNDAKILDWVSRLWPSRYERYTMVGFRPDKLS